MPAVEFGFKDGYRSEGHTGPNNVAARVGIECPISESAALNGYVGYTVAIDREPDSYADDELLKDFAFGGIGISLNY